MISLTSFFSELDKIASTITLPGGVTKPFTSLTNTLKASVKSPSVIKANEQIAKFKSLVH
jgi:hypothetical protein